jgi:hypothetical protein
LSQQPILDKTDLQTEVINSESTQQVSTSLKRNFDGADEEEFSQSILKKPKKGRNRLFKFHKISQTDSSGDFFYKNSKSIFTGDPVKSEAENEKSTQTVISGSILILEFC